MKHKEHICRFNDGEQSCDCYDAGYKYGRSVASFNSELDRIKKEVRVETLKEVITLSDKIETKGNTTLEERKAFKRFRNTLRDSIEKE